MLGASPSEVFDMEKSFDQKIARIRQDPGCRDFILADAKDADMGFGTGAPGLNSNGGHKRHAFRSLGEYRQSMREITRQGLVDIMLMSASTSQLLTIEERLFDDSPVTPAVRANDSTDIWLADSGAYTSQPSLPFRTTTIEHIQHGTLAGNPNNPPRGADLGLYSITLNNDVHRDRETLEAYNVFRREAEAKGFRHFLEVFAPNAVGDRRPADVGRFVNDCIARTLAGVTRSGRPLFLKMPYFGPAALESLVHYDPSLIVGILGGSAGTTHDAFHLVWETKRYGARAALFGRKINNAEDQLTFVKYLRLIADDQLQPEEAVKAYHGDLQRADITPNRSLDNDIQLTQSPV